ncbi:ATP-grasp domain-containing protein [Halostella pelagica]|uniref:ATP-grasp domain-containing protein n=1 Tax=Halostella pelagica TaxID=2583824 RepID=UPI001080C618|nr:RimK family alpha-L-glutamate ligase [Halostella pelagica]
MLRLAVANREETFERMADPLEERGIEAVHVPARERAIALTGDDPFDATDDGRFAPDGFDAGFVFPGRIMEGGAVDALLDVPWLNGREAVLTSRNKGAVIAELGQAGLPVPETVMVSNPADRADLVDAFERFDPPVVVKPNSATRGAGVAKAHDLDSFLGVVDYLDLVHDYRATGDKTFLVQEYLPEATDYRAMVVDGEFVGAVERRLPGDALAAGQWKHNVHRGAVAEGVDLSAELCRLAERTAATLGVRFLGVDLLVTPDRTVVNETNARPTIDAATKYRPDFYDRIATAIRDLV